MREFNTQCIVLSTSGLEHTAIVSNNGTIEEDMIKIILGHFPEHQGMHYVSLQVDFDDYYEFIAAARRNDDTFLQSNPSNSNISFSEGDADDVHTTNASPSVEELDNDFVSTDEQKTGNDAKKRRQKVLKTQVEQMRRKQNSQSDRRKKHVTTILILPPEILTHIFKICITAYPQMRYVLQKVSPYFLDIVRGVNIPVPEIHITSACMENVPNPISVRRIMRRSGANSGLTCAVRNIIREPRWANAWLRLNQVGIGWYRIVDIWFRSKATVNR